MRRLAHPGFAVAYGAATVAVSGLVTWGLVLLTAPPDEEGAAIGAPFVFLGFWVASMFSYGFGLAKSAGKIERRSWLKPVALAYASAAVLALVAGLVIDASDPAAAVVAGAFLLAIFAAPSIGAAYLGAAVARSVSPGEQHTGPA